MMRAKANWLFRQPSSCASPARPMIYAKIVPPSVRNRCLANGWSAPYSWRARSTAEPDHASEDIGLAERIDEPRFHQLRESRARACRRYPGAGGARPAPTPRGSRPCHRYSRAATGAAGLAGCRSGAMPRARCRGRCRAREFSRFPVLPRRHSSLNQPTFAEWRNGRRIANPSDGTDRSRGRHSPAADDIQTPAPTEKKRLWSMAPDMWTARTANSRSSVRFAFARVKSFNRLEFDPAHTADPLGRVEDFQRDEIAVGVVVEAHARLVLVALRDPHIRLQNDAQRVGPAILGGFHRLTRRH